MIFDCRRPLQPAQLRYIHRGNYGLISAEEMMKAGVSEAYADELMRIKLKFAFGQIARPEAFVDWHVLAGEPIEIGNGVSIHYPAMDLAPGVNQIGRASCRERV